MAPSNLDILLKHYASISHIPVCIQSATPEDCGDFIRHFYTAGLNVEAGCAGYIVTDEYVFCGKILDRETGRVVLLGPATEYPLTADTVTHIIKQLGLPRRDIREMRQLLGDLPMASLSLFLNHLSFLNYLINGKSDFLPQLSVHADAGRQFRRDLSSEPVHHNTAQYENHLMKCIEYGLLDQAQSALTEVNLLGLNMGKVSNTSLSALKNIMITSTTLACRAAVLGGMDYDRAMSLSDAYIQQTEHIQSAHDHYQLFTEMILDFTKRVHDLRLCGSGTQLVRDVAQCINGRLYQKITVESLARAHNVSSSYLSHHFHQCTGIRLTDYIARQKIDEAIRLMQTTNLSLAQIAYQLAFSSQSYFHATFKKVTGVNPGKYPRSRRRGVEL